MNVNKPMHEGQNRNACIYEMSLFRAKLPTHYAEKHNWLGERETGVIKWLSHVFCGKNHNADCENDEDEDNDDVGDADDDDDNDDIFLVCESLE